MLYHKLSLNNFIHWVLRSGFENAKRGADSPITYRFSIKEVQNMCSAFNSCDIGIEYLFGAGWGKAYDLMPKPIYFFLSKKIGWHLVVYLEK